MRCTYLLTIASFAILSAISSSDPNANPVDVDDENDTCEDVESAECEGVYTQMMDETNDLMDMWDILNCDPIMEHQRPIHNESTWAYLRGAYIASVGYLNSDISYDQIYGNGFAPDSIIVKHHPDKGRAVYANQFFRKGDKVWKESSACFTKGRDYRHFLASIPAHLACDVFLWAYSSKRYGVCVDLDEGSLINHASAADNENIDRDHPNLLKVNAIRDIYPGDEILCDYGGFSEADAWAELGLGSWGEDIVSNNYYENPEDYNDDDDDDDDTF